MNISTSYQLNVDTIESLDDVKVILDKLNLTTYAEGDDWVVLQKYFTTEVQTKGLSLPGGEMLEIPAESVVDVNATTDD
jgi:hypothetical protein